MWIWVDLFTLRTQCWISHLRCVSLLLTLLLYRIWGGGILSVSRANKRHSAQLYRRKAPARITCFSYHHHYTWSSRGRWKWRTWKCSTWNHNTAGYKTGTNSKAAIIHFRLCSINISVKFSDDFLQRTILNTVGLIMHTVASKLQWIASVPLLVNLIFCSYRLLTK